MSAKFKVFIQETSGVLFMPDGNVDRRADMVEHAMTNEEIVAYNKNLLMKSVETAKEVKAANAPATVPDPAPATPEVAIATQEVAAPASEIIVPDLPPVPIVDQAPATDTEAPSITSLSSNDPARLRDLAKSRNIKLPPNLKDPDKIREIIKESMLPAAPVFAGVPDVPRVV